MSDLIRQERTNLPYWICLIHAIGILCITLTGLLLLLRVSNFFCGGVGGLWALVPHLFGVFHAWSFPTCAPASRALLFASLGITSLSALMALVTIEGAMAPRGDRGNMTAALLLLGFAPILQHAVEHAAFARARRIANETAPPRSPLDDDLDISL